MTEPQKFELCRYFDEDEVDIIDAEGELVCLVYKPGYGNILVDKLNQVTYFDEIKKALRSKKNTLVIRKRIENIVNRFYEEYNTTIENCDVKSLPIVGHLTRQLKKREAKKKKWMKSLTRLREKYGKK